MQTARTVDKQWSWFSSQGNQPGSDSGGKVMKYTL